MEDYAETITLTDQDGSEIPFAVLDVVPYEGKEYAVLFPLEDDSDQAEAVVLELLPLEEGAEEDVLKGVEDKATLEAVFGLFLARSGGSGEA